MGLDMYLEKCKAEVYAYINEDLEKMEENNPRLYRKLKPYIIEKGEYIHWESLSETVAYWRKANSVHNWFVENVQNGEDDCRNYRVSKNELEELLNLCVKVIETAILTTGQVHNGTKYTPNGREELYEEGKVILNVDAIEELLPTASGFFFGSTEYDEYYIEDIKSTIEQLTQVLTETDWDNEVVFYHSSW